MTIDIQLTRDIAQYATQKRGAQQEYGGRLPDDVRTARVKLPCLSWGVFLNVTKDDNRRHIARIPAIEPRIEELSEQHRGIVRSDWAERDGHAFMDVLLDGSVPLETLKPLIDEAYLLMQSKLDENGKLMIEWADSDASDLTLMDQLIDYHQLHDYRGVIHRLGKPGVLFRTQARTNSFDAAIGATKVGGEPDVAEGEAWPLYEDGRPLTFLAQFDLADVARVGGPFTGLPTDGLLSIFSAWGWVEEGDLEPQPPETGWQDQAGWTVVRHISAGVKLQRLATPPRACNFPGAAAESIGLTCLPNHRVDPPLAAIGWTDDVYDRFDEMQSDYRSVQMARHVDNMDTFASHHLLGGYGVFQQSYPDELLDSDRTMLLQIGTDDNVGMCWSDGGELTFFADEKALHEGRIERIWGECQGG